MRGSLSYSDLFDTITVEDREILTKFVKEQIETVNKTGLPIL